MQERREPERLQRHRLAAGVRAADHERAQGAEIEVDRNGELRVEERVAGAASRTSSDTSTGAPFQPRESVAQRQRHVDLARASTAAVSCAAASPTAAESSRRIRSTSSRSALAASDWRLRELDDVERLDEERLARVGGVVDDPGHAPAGTRLHREHRPAAAQGDELLLQVLAQLARADELLELVAHALPAGAQLAAQLAQLRRGVVAQVGAVLLDGAVDRLRDSRERRVDGVGECAEQRRRGLVECGARPQRRRRPCRRPASAPAARALHPAPRAQPARARRGSPRAAARATLPGARSPRRSAPGAGRPPPGRATARARPRAPCRSRSPSHARPAPGSPETPARRARSGPSDRV